MVEMTQGWIRRSASAVIEITGEDAPDFLQSQFSADLRMSVGHFREGLWLNHRARIEGESFLLKLEAERFLLISRSTPADILMAKLDRHIISEEVELSDLTLEWEVILAFGDREALLGLGLFASNEVGVDCFSYQNNNYVLSFLDRAEPFVFVAGHRDALDEVYSKLEGSILPLWKEATYKRFRLSRSMVEIPSEVGSEETPAEVGLLGVCSLQKGCYLGQEVVNRQSRLERVVKRLVRVALSSCPGERLDPAPTYISVYLDDQIVGELRGWTEDEPCCGLAVLKTKALEADLTLGSKDGPRVEVLGHE